MTRHYEPPEGFVPGTVFDPESDTFGPIMGAIAAGEFGKAATLLTQLEHPGKQIAIVRYDVTGVTAAELAFFLREASAGHGIRQDHRRPVDSEIVGPS